MDLLTSELEPSPAAAPLLAPADLQRCLHEVEPAAWLVRPRILRRVIKLDRELTGLGLKVPHRKTYLIHRARLLELVDPAELGVPDAAALPAKVMLIAQPDVDEQDETSAQSALQRVWRLLFHLRVHQALEQQVADGRLDARAVQHRIDAVGPAAFAEIRTVLRQEDFLLPPRDDVSIYIEFAAVYLELRYFAPSLLTSYFPAISSHEKVEELLALDVDAAALYRQSRPAGATEPVDISGPPEETSTELSPIVRVAKGPKRDDHARRLLRRADRAAAVGNVVRSAMLRWRAANMASARLSEEARSLAQADIDRLVHRLVSALEERAGNPQPWREALVELLALTATGIWTAEARLLYDLQKVCVDYERDIYTVDVVRWAMSRGREPIQRPLPSQREVLMSKHLHSAARRLAAVRIAEARRRQLAELLTSAAERAEERLRDRFRPLIAAALDDVGLAPQNVPERVAQKKLVEELLDRVVDRGFLRMGDLRDALSRNNLKLPDFAGYKDFLRGDQLLRVDRRLGTLLDGVYERGEIYLRWMQQLSSLAFGTRTGRFLTRYVAIPFGGAFVLLEFIQHVVHKLADYELGQSVAGEVLETAHETVHRMHVNSPGNVALLGLLFLLLLHVEPFRRMIAQGLRAAGRGAKRVLIDLPRWLYRQELVQAVVRSKAFSLAMRFIVKPLAFTALIGLFVPLKRIPPTTLAGSGLAVFLSMNLLLNSPLGRQVQEVIADWLVQTWHRFGLRILTGLFWFVVDLFRTVLEAIERFLYAVDEWLRFKSGESQLSLVVKGALGLVWFLVTYVVRFCVNLLIEPQVNPIKHFPVVTVSHKLLLGFIPLLTSVLAITMDKALALVVATIIITSIPGIFGFLVWELKENWRLYAANRRKTLGPVAVGHHSETMARLLKPGFHSGTVPKLYARLRRAERKARQNGRWKPIRKHRQALHHVELAIRRYVQREFIELLHQSRAWQGPRISLGRIDIASNQICMELLCPELGEESLWIALEQRCGWLVANIVRNGWFDRLLPQQRRVLNSALLGLYKTAHVDLVCEHIEAALQLPDPCRLQGANQAAVLDFAEDALLIRVPGTSESQVTYPLRQPRCVPHIADHQPSANWPDVPREEIVFRDEVVEWTEWVYIWEQDARGNGHPRDLLASLCVVPGAAGQV